MIYRASQAVIVVRIRLYSDARLSKPAAACPARTCYGVSSQVCCHVPRAMCSSLGVLNKEQHPKAAIDSKLVMPHGARRIFWVHQP